MRQSLVVAAALSALALSSCTVKSADAPPISGPSTFANNIVMEATPDVIAFDPTVGATITVTVKDEMGQPKALDLVAEIRINGVVQDFGTLSAKTISTNPSTGVARVTYFPPNSPVKSYQTVTIAVYPIGTSYGSQLSRSVDLRLVPQGTIGPSNPTLTAAFTYSPSSPAAFAPTVFNASTSTNQGSACGSACTYSWDFGDGTSGSGITVTHEFRVSGSKTVTLTITDSIGARASTSQVVTLTAPTPPTASMSITPTGNLAIDQVFFLSAAASKPAAGRSIVSYAWAFGDGNYDSGVTTSFFYRAAGTYTITLTVTDDAGSTAFATQGVTVVAGAATGNLVATPTSPKVNISTTFDASGIVPFTGSTITRYVFNFGDGTATVTTTSATTTHTYTTAGTFGASVTVTDSQGRSTIKTLSIVVQP